ncbi:MAG: carbohydrate binding family 9 domain-containing protein [Proteobacteria bacterium]|nr:carbohydrate binding family 9 domain-containing protein [Pseudomonadota bacterium]
MRWTAVILHMVFFAGPIVPSAIASPIELARLDQAPVVDGVGDEPAWRNIEPVTTIVYGPVYNDPPSQRTEIRIAYYDDGIYVYGHMFDNQPQDVRANSLYRDEYAGDDTLGLIIDVYNDNDTALWFYTTPAGMRADGAIWADMASGEPDWSWDGYWDAAARQTDSGWTAEMRIPFSTLGAQTGAENAIMGVSVYRWLARHNERHVWPVIPPKWPRAYAKPSKLKDVALVATNAPRTFFVSPYGLTGYRAPDDLDGEFELEAGVDARYSFSNTTIDFTINTDFAQVEADDERINLTRFPLFFPEKRQFFLDRASVFAFDFSGSDRLFHSRRIGLVDGRPVRILAGARAAGRIGRWDIGALDMQTQGRDSTPGENFAVVRLRRQIGDGLSSAGAMITSRVGSDDTYNFTAGADSTTRVVGDEYMQLKWAYSRGRRFDGSAQLERADGNRVMIAWQRRRLDGLSYQAALDWAQAGFEPGIGFEERDDTRALRAVGGYQWLLEEGLLSRISFATAGDIIQRNGDNRVDSAFAEPSVTAETRRGHTISAAAIYRYEDVVERFTLADDIAIKPGTYTTYLGRLEAGLSSSRRLRGSIGVEFGQYFDGSRALASVAPAWTPSRHLDLAAEYEIGRIDLPDRPRLWTHVGRLRLRLALNIRISLSALAQYSSEVDRLGVNARFRWHLREGNDLWLVYDHRAATDDMAGSNGDDHELPGRTVLVKYTHSLLLPAWR